MSLQHGWKRTAAVIAVFVVVWLGLRYLYPLFLPFLLGLAGALAAQPLIKFLQKNLHFSPSAAIFSAVTALWAALAGAAALGVVFLLRRAGALAGSLSTLAGRAAEGVSTARDWAVELASHAPGPIAEPLTQSVRELFGSGSALLDRGTEVVFDLAGHAAQHIPGTLMTLGTAILSAYLICPRLPALKQRLSRPSPWRSALIRLGRNALCWLRAQLKLSAVTFAIVLTGFFLLGVPGKLVMAALTALVDAVPLLGTGTVLVPWALVSFLSGEPVRAVGLLGVYVTALLTRSALEPKLLGRQLGLDPLAALVALYIGFRLWGFGGMILAPILTVTARELCRGD